MRKLIDIHMLRIYIIHFFFDICCIIRINIQTESVRNRIVACAFNLSICTYNETQLI